MQQGPLIAPGVLRSDAGLREDEFSASHHDARFRATFFRTFFHAHVLLFAFFFCFDSYVIYVDRGSYGEVVWDLSLIAVRVAAHLAPDHLLAHHISCWVYCVLCAGLAFMGLGLRQAEQHLAPETVAGLPPAVGSGDEVAGLPAVVSTDYLLLMTMPAIGILGGIVHGSWGLPTSIKFGVIFVMIIYGVYLAFTSIQPSNRPIWMVVGMGIVCGVFTMHQVERAMWEQHQAAMKAGVIKAEEDAAREANAEADKAASAADAARVAEGGETTQSLAREALLAATEPSLMAHDTHFETTAPASTTRTRTAGLSSSEETRALRERIDSLEAEKERLDYERRMEQHDARRARAALLAIEQQHSGVSSPRPRLQPHNVDGSNPSLPDATRRAVGGATAGERHEGSAALQEPPAPTDQVGLASICVEGTGIVAPRARAGEYVLAERLVLGSPSANCPLQILSGSSAPSISGWSSDDGSVTWSMQQAQTSHRQGMLISQPVPLGFFDATPRAGVNEAADEGSQKAPYTERSSALR